MRIKKLQGGGFATFTPIVPNMPVNPVRPSGSDSSESKTESSSLLDKDVYKKLIEAGGLVNDVNHFVEQVQELESSGSYLDPSNRNSAIMLVGKVNELIQSRKY
jgi:hypothetical protein